MGNHYLRHAAEGLEVNSELRQKALGVAPAAGEASLADGRELEENGELHVLAPVYLLDQTGRLEHHQLALLSVLVGLREEHRPVAFVRLLANQLRRIGLVGLEPRERPVLVKPERNRG